MPDSSPQPASITARVSRPQLLLGLIGAGIQLSRTPRCMRRKAPPRASTRSTG
ncbi:hypothetical protein ACFQU7_39445 [Pseudoroseomonas wenyumeiae]